jgi:hypothetical protein
LFLEVPIYMFFVALVFQTCFLDYLLPIQNLRCKQGSSSTSSFTPFTSWVLAPSLNCQLNKDNSLIARETDRHRQTVLHKFLCTIWKELFFWIQLKKTILKRCVGILNHECLAAILQHTSLVAHFQEYAN